jgi:hypothetical protein
MAYKDKTCFLYIPSAPYLRLIVSEQCACADDSNLLFAVYLELKEVWHHTKVEANRQWAMRAYNAWIIGSFPVEQRAPLLLSSSSAWGFN